MFLGAILFVIKDIPVEPSMYSSDMEFDSIEEGGDGPSPEGDIDDGSGAYRGSSSRGLITRRHLRNVH